MQRAELIDHCVALYEAYDSNTTTIDSHADEYIADHHITETDDVLFIKQVFYGCLRYKKMLKILLDHFYSQHSGTTLFRDFTCYMIFAYLAIVRMDELTFKEFRKFVLSLPAIKMHVFVEFLFDRDSLMSIKDEWCKHYEENFVQESFVNQLLKWPTEAEELKNKLKQLVSGLQKNEFKNTTNTKPPTVIEPFNITKPKSPKPQPQSSPPQPSLTKVRRSFDKDRLAQEQENNDRQLQLRKDDNRKKLQDKYSDPNYSPFQFLSRERPSKKEKIARELEEQTQQIMRSGPKALPAPTVLPPSVPVKLNTAAILREEAFYKKKQEEEAKALEMYEASLHDQTDYNLWQEQMREQEMLKRMEEIDRRRIETQQMQEDLQRAKEEALLKKREAAAAMAAEQKALQEQNQQKIKEEQMQNKATAEEIKISRQAAVDAKQKLKTQNRKIVQEVNKEKEVLKKQVEEEREVERKKREDLIRQIRALERVSNKAASNVFDPAECQNNGYFNEMSIAELKERLVLMAQREQELLEEKRNEILQQKQKKADEILTKAQKIAQLRAKMEKDAAAKREARKNMEEARKKREQERYEGSVLQMNDKLKDKKEAKQAEADRIAQDRKQAGQRAEFLFENREMLEEKKFKEKEKGEEREAKMNQLKTQQAAALSEKRKQEQEQLRKKSIAQKQKQEQENIKERKKEKETVRIQEQQRASARQTPKTSATRGTREVKKQEDTRETVP